jgi:glycosyltransferase involved in cell wall biosynthesis
LRILTVLDYLPNVIGGAEVSAFLVSKGLLHQGNEVFVVAEKTSSSADYCASFKTTHGFSEVFRSRVVSPKTKPLWVVDDLVSLALSFLSTLRFIKRLRPDVIFTHKRAGLGAVVAARLLNVPSVYVVRGYQHDCFNSEKIRNTSDGVKSCNLTKCDVNHFFSCAKVYGGQNKVINFLQIPFSVYGCFVMQIRQHAISNATVLVGISGAVERSLKAVYPRNAMIKIYNPMEMADMSIKVVTHDPFARYFIYIGRLAPAKGVSVLLHAFKSLHDTYPQCKLAIIGSGPEEAHLKTLTSDLELDSVVTFFGHLPAEKVFNFLKTHGFATVVPSLWEEAFGRVIIESMTMGVPVIATKMGGMTELIADKETGLLVNPGDETGLFFSMSRLVEEKALYERIITLSSEFVKSFSVREISSEYQELIKSLVVNTE